MALFQPRETILSEMPADASLDLVLLVQLADPLKVQSYRGLVSVPYGTEPQRFTELLVQLADPLKVIQSHRGLVRHRVQLAPEV